MSDKDRSKMRARRPSNRAADSPRRQAFKVTCRVPKRPDARPECPEDWDEYGPDQPLPQPIQDRMAEVLAPCLFDWMFKLGLHHDDFDEETWGPFVHASIPCFFGVADDEQKEEMVRTVRTALEKKLGRPLVEVDCLPPNPTGPTRPEALNTWCWEYLHRNVSEVGPRAFGVHSGPPAL